MDLFGKRPTSKVGEYFRNNVWWWHPLWDYCESYAPKIAGKVKQAHNNSGDGLGKRDSMALAKKLEDLISRGHTKLYEEAYIKRMDRLPLETCKICYGKGKRAEAPMIGPGNIECNGCGGTGKRKQFATWYPFSVENVKEFVEFLKYSGGFEIC